MNERRGWRVLLDENLEILEDCHAYRYVERLSNRCTAYVCFLRTATTSRNVAFWYEDYRTPADAVLAAKAWTMKQSVLEHEPAGDFRYRLALGKVVEPEPEVFREATNYGSATRQK